jgi:MobA/MobL family
MALFSFRHSVKTFSDKRSAEARAAKHGQTAAHLKYITRPQAARVIVRTRLAHPTDALLAVAAEREAETRKGRVCERFILALPVEATAEQREALVKAFCEAITHGVAGYVAAIHDQRGNDTMNPHAHIAAFDVQVKGGGRGRPRSTIGMARKNAIEETAALWAGIHNRMMTAWGYGAESQISHLSFAARGIDRLPEIHEGAASRQMFAQGETPATKSDWHHIDSGHTRAEANVVIREINSLKQETHHDQAEPTHRLGNYDEGDRSECAGRGKDDRAGGGSPIGNAGPLAPPWAAVVADGSDDEGGEGAASAPAPPPFLATNDSTTPFPPFATDRGVHGWRGVRRVYRELVMLRDTLRARLFGRREGQQLARSIGQQINQQARSERRRVERD